MLGHSRNVAGRCSWGFARGALQGLTREMQSSACSTAESELALPSYIRGGQGNMFTGMPFSDSGASDLQLSHHQPGMLLNYRSSYPADLFREIASLPSMPNGTNRDVLELTACPQKLCGHYLKSRQFQVTSFDISSLLQMSQARLETYTVPDVESQAVPEIFKKVSTKSLDAVCFFHTFHMLDTSAMLSELHRILRCPGYLVAAWNDRDLSHPCNQELEDILEAYNPLYSRFLRQREPSLWNSVFTEGDLFRIHKYTAFENHLRVEHADHLVELLGAMAFMNHALPAASPRRASFSQAVHAMVRRHFGSQQPFMLPLETRLYVLQRGCEQELHGSCNCPH